MHLWKRNINISNFIISPYKIILVSFSLSKYILYVTNARPVFKQSLYTSHFLMSVCIHVQNIIRISSTKNLEIFKQKIKNLYLIYPSLKIANFLQEISIMY
jgi:hypothetical protein